VQTDYQRSALAVAGGGQNGGLLKHVFWVDESYPTEMYESNGFRKSTPPQICQLDVHYYQLQQEVDGCVRDLTF
jgi:hypothetical protein